jgi:hypothetical protein
MADLSGTVADIQGEVVLTFSKYLDPSTINFTNISMDMQPTTGTIAYYPELKKVVINGTWTNSNAWHKITIKPGLHSVAGLPIDGNGNGKQDGSPYDDIVVIFGTGDTTSAPGGAGARPDLVHPKLTSAYPLYVGYVAIYPTLYFQFDANDVDTNTVRTSATLKDENGVTKSLKSAGTNWNGSRLRVYFQPTAPDSPLVYDKAYTWSINLNTVQDTHNNKAIWLNYGYVSSLPVVTYPFRTIWNTGNRDPLHYSTNSVSGNEVVIAFDDSLDYTTFSTNAVKLFKGSAGTLSGQVYGRLYYQPSDVPAHQIRFTLENAAPGSGTYTMYIARYVKDNEGLFLDGNGNGIGGESGANTWLGIVSDDYYFTITR